MRSRALQLGILIALGIGLGLLLSRNWHQPEPVSAVPAPTVEDAPAPAEPVTRVASEAKQANTDVAAPPPRQFKLPAVATATANAAAVSSAPKAAETTPRRPLEKVMMPAGWLLRGTAPQDYDLLSDRTQMHGGSASALLRSHDKNISPGLSGSMVQQVVAEPLLGKRLQVSAYLKGEEVRAGSFNLWLTAVDPNNLLLATESSGKQFPAATSEWTQVSFVVDVPWSAARVMYGVSLAGMGTLWIDDLKLDAVDRAAMDLTSTAIPRQLGQPVIQASAQGGLPRPENLNFEESVEVEAPLREKPPSSVSGIRQ